MAPRVVHATVAVGADAGNGEIHKSQWNEDHTITGLATVAGTGAYSDLMGTPTIPSAANPTASVGISAVNGSASTFMRSDAAPALDQTAAYAFSGLGKTAITATAANNTPLSISGYSLTGSNTIPAQSISGTWNTSGVAEGLTIDFTDTASGVLSKFIQVKRSGTRIFEVALGTPTAGGAKNPYAYIEGPVGLGNGPGFYVGQTADSESRIVISTHTDGVAQLSMGPGNASRDAFMTRPFAGLFQLLGTARSTSAGGFVGPVNWSDGAGAILGRLTFTANGGDPAVAAGASKGLVIYTNNATKVAGYFASGGNFAVASDAVHGFSSTTSANGTIDTFLSRAAAATLQLGTANAASPVAQTLQAQGSRAGTDSNVGGASLTVQPGTGTGSGSNSLKLMGMVGAGTATGAQTPTVGITVPSVANGQLPGVVVGSGALATNATDGFLYIPQCAGTPTGTPTAQTGRVPMVWDTTNKKFYIYDGGWLGGTAPGVFS